MLCTALQLGWLTFLTCLPFLPDGSLDGGWGDLPELLEFGDFVEPYWDSDT